MAFGVPCAGESDDQRPAQPARCIVPATGGCDLAHARGGGADLRREATRRTSGCSPTSSRASAWCRATGSASRRFRSPRPARAGSTTSTSTCATTCATPRSRSRAASASCRCSPPASSRTTCAATGRCGRCGSWKASIAIASRSSPRPTTRSSTVSPASTSSACSSRPTRSESGPWRPEPAPSAAGLVTEALLERVTNAGELVRPLRRRRATPAQDRQPHRGDRRRRRRAGLGGCATGAVDPLQRRPGRARPAVHLDARLARRRQGDQEHARRDGQRCRADRGHARAAPAPDAARRGHRRSRAEGVRAGERAHRGPARNARQPGLRDAGHAAGLLRGSRAVPGEDLRPDARGQGLRAGHRGEGADRTQRLRPADAAPRGGPAGHAPARRQPRRDQRAGTAVARSTSTVAS